MPRQIAFRMNLFPGRAAEYRKRHDEIFPELSAALKGAGVSDYSIWLDPEANHLFGILTLSDDNTLDELPDTAIMKRWWAHMADIMATDADNGCQCEFRSSASFTCRERLRDQGRSGFHAGAGRGRPGTYFKPGENAEHWLIDSLIANPMSGYELYREKRISWGIDALGSLVVEIETAGGGVGRAAGSGGAPAAWLIHNHFARFLVGEDARNVNKIWDELFRASLPYGRKGLPLMAISAVDLALWDSAGRLRNEPVYNLIGGASRREVSFYCTAPAPDSQGPRLLGGQGAAAAQPFRRRGGPQKERRIPGTHRDSVGTDFR